MGVLIPNKTIACHEDVSLKEEFNITSQSLNIIIYN